jgi:hypothetical protein
MNPSEKKRAKKNDRRTKAQLLKELENAHNKLDRHEKKLTDCQKKLAKAESDISTWKEKSIEFELMKIQLESNQQKIEKYRHDPKRKNQENGKAVAGLKKAIGAAEPSNSSMPGGISTAKATFRIDLYPRQGHFQGKIVHPLTKDDRVLKGLDVDAIMEFISEHLPHQEEEATEPQKTPTKTKESPPVAEMEPEYSSTLKLRDLKIIPAGASSPSNVLRSGQTFQVSLTLDPTEAVSEYGVSMAYKINIYTKRLGGGSRQMAGAVSGNIKSTDLFTAIVASAPLSSGAYKIEADASFNPSIGETEMTAVLQESNLIHVY